LDRLPPLSPEKRRKLERFLQKIKDELNARSEDEVASDREKLRKLKIALGIDPD
jgi:hypothetical protein